MVHAGFPGGLVTVDEKIREQIENDSDDTKRMLIGKMFSMGYTKIVLDTNLKNTGAQHVPILKDLVEEFKRTM